MTDKELLELAAKAAGSPISEGYFEETDRFSAWVYMCGDWLDYWNPLENDTDAFRLMVKTFIEVGYDVTDNEVFAGGANELGCEFESCDTDPYAATRRAIVRAAAEIGKKMEEEK